MLCSRGSVERQSFRIGNLSMYDCNFALAPAWQAATSRAVPQAPWSHFTICHRQHVFAGKDPSRMPLDRIARLVRMAAVDSGISAALRNQPADLQAPLGLTAHQVSVLTASSAAPTPAVASKLVARAAVANTVPEPVATANEDIPAISDPLLPPEGQGEGQTPAPVILAPLPSLPHKPVPAPAATPGPSRPGPAPGPIMHLPAPFHAPAPLGPMPWQSNLPAPSPFSPGSFYPIPSMPVLRQPQPSPQTSTQTLNQPSNQYLDSADSQTTTGTDSGTHVSSTPDFSVSLAQSLPASQTSQPSDGCDCCCIQVTALVATVATTSQTAITAITAIASQR